MLTPFEELKPQSRIWIYQADRRIDNEDQQAMLNSSEKFIQEWAAHGQSLLASACVMHNQFLVIATDENFNLASGCSIDSSFRFVQGLGNEMSYDFFQRTNLAFYINQEVKLVSLSNLKKEIAEGNIDNNTLFFDNNINTKAELHEKWIVNAGESWLKRYFQVTPNVL